MGSTNREEAASSSGSRTVPMDAKLMVAPDRGDVNKLKEVLKQDDAVPMVVVTGKSKKPSKEDGNQPLPGNINPLLLASARVGSWKGLNVLLGRENSATMIPTQEFLMLLVGGSSSTQGRVAAPDVEEGVADDQPASWLTDGALLKGVTPDGDTALHAVASNGDGQDFLKYAGILYDRHKGLLIATNHKGDTPLHCAARSGNFKMVSHLINLAAREGPAMKLRLLRMENKHQETALHKAVRYEDGRLLGRKERVALLAAAPAGGEEKNKGVQNGDGTSKENNIVKLLMGADSNLANYPADGVSPLYLAILLGKSTIALTLYDMNGGNLSYSGADGQNALHVGVLRDTVMVEFLLHWNKNLTTEVDKDGSAPLHFASSVYFWTGSYLYFVFLRRSPWCRFICIPWRYSGVLQCLLESNPATLYQADKNGCFPIHVAASVGAKGVIQLFHEKYPSCVGLRDTKGRTFLHVAVESGSLGIVYYACKTPGLAWILNMEDNDGSTALHLAIQVQSFRMFCALFGNQKVNLNVTNNQGQSPRDLSRSKLPNRMGYGLNSENKICNTLWSVGANEGALRWDKANEKYSRRPKPEDEEKESERLRNAAQALIVASVLIATVAFSATFALPGGYRGDGHPNAGAPVHAGSYLFDAFMMATTLAFICSSVSTVGFVFAATPMVSLFTRRVNFNVSVFFMWSSVTCMSIAFALGVYMVLAPVARGTAVVVCVITPAILLSANMEIIIKLVILARPLCTRIGLYPAIVQLLKMHLFVVVSTLWPFIATFGWAALARIHHHG